MLFYLFVVYSLNYSNEQPVMMFVCWPFIHFFIPKAPFLLSWISELLFAIVLVPLDLLET